MTSLEKPNMPRILTTLLTLITVGELAGCSTVHAVKEDYTAEFLGSYRVMDRSSERIMPLQDVRLSISPAGRTLIVFQTAKGNGTRTANCFSSLGQWDRALHSPTPNATYRGYDCTDDSGTRWQFVHAAPGSSSITQLFNKPIRREVTSGSGYLLFVSSQGTAALDFALDPDARPGGDHN